MYDCRKLELRYFLCSTGLVCTEYAHFVYDHNGDTTLEVLALFASVEMLSREIIKQRGVDGGAFVGLHSSLVFGWFRFFKGIFRARGFRQQLEIIVCISFGYGLRDCNWREC